MACSQLSSGSTSCSSTWSSSGSWGGTLHPRQGKEDGEKRFCGCMWHALRLRVLAPHGTPEQVAANAGRPADGLQ